MESETAPKPPSARIIEAMGGVRKAARRLNKSPTTVQYWAEKGIPHRHQQLVLETCRREAIRIEGREVSPADFFDPMAGAS